MNRTVDFSGVLSFVAKRRKASGGYGATPRLPATIEDTFEAVAISRHLARLAPETALPFLPEEDLELHDYLRDAAGKAWPGLRTTQQLLTTCNALAVPINPERIRDYTTRHRAESADLGTAYYCTLIDREAPSQAATYPAEAIPGLTDRPTVRDVRMYLTLLKLADRLQAINRVEMIAWLRRCQNGDGGFGFFPGTTSYIENSHHCLAALNILSATPAQPETARQFILSCQTGTGGFGRSLRSAPFLDSTWHALASLHLLF